MLITTLPPLSQKPDARQLYSIAPIIVVFFSACIFITTPALATSTTVSAFTCGQQKQVTKLNHTQQWQVIDGDTLVLNGTQKLRLNRINTPELDRDGQADQPLAQAATNAVNQFFATNNNLYWQLGQDPKDRHGRLLGSVYNAQGHWLGAHLVNQGLAFAISFPASPVPACLWQLEAQAKEHKLGIWHTSLGKPLASQYIKPQDSGFRLLQGTVTKVDKTRQDWYVELDDTVVLRISQDDWQQATRQTASPIEQPWQRPEAWLQQNLQARGWLTWRKLSKSQQQRGFKPALMVVTHPDMLQ